jgi:transposase
VANILSFRWRNSLTHDTILADLGYLGIKRTCPRAILPHKRQPARKLGEAQKEHNRKLSRDRILVENFFSRWKNIFGICYGVDRGSLKKLSAIIKVTIALTNWHVERHPLRPAGGHPGDGSEEEPQEEVRELDQDSRSSE